MTLLYEDESKECFPFSVTEQTKRLIRTVCIYFHCPYEAEVSLILVDKEEIKNLNAEYRNIDQPTDVLSFPMCEFDKPAVWSGDLFEKTKSLSPETEELLFGDIVICSEIVKEQAKEYGHSEEREFSFLIVHSLLHLMGFDHAEEEERILMEEKQKDIMSICNIKREA